MTEELQETIDSTNDEQVETTTEETQEEQTEEGSEEKFSENEKKLYARLKKAEAKLNEYKSVGEEKEIKKEKTEPEYLSRDEAKFYAQGGSDEELTQVRKIMDATGVSLTEAQNDELFLAWKDKQEAKRKSEDAQLSASGRGRMKMSENIKTREDHKAYAAKIASKIG